MKHSNCSILIVTPHFPPSNLAAVHRSRLFAQHLPSFGWTPIILTVHEEYYEEKLDWTLHQLLPPNLRIEKVKAFATTKPRLVGDIGLRAFFQLYKKGKQLVNDEKIDFLYIPIPSFYTALLGRWLHHSTGIKYGIDYIDPWVHRFPGSNKIFSRHWFSTKLASILEPIAVKKAALITGVAAGYYEGVMRRNPKVRKDAIFLAMPYGGEKNDHKKLQELKLSPYLFNKKEDKLQLVYAGAMLPKAIEILKAVFSAIKLNRKLFDNVEIHFIGTGKLANDNSSFNIKDLAESYGLWKEVVYEYPARIPYLDVLIHLHAAAGAFILGSTERHYTPSKIYQAILSQKPILAVLHSESSAVKIITNSNSGIVLSFNSGGEITVITELFASFYTKYLSFIKAYTNSAEKEESFLEYSAYSITKQLSEALNNVVSVK